jgi:hypothetical protein
MRFVPLVIGAVSIIITVANRIQRSVIGERRFVTIGVIMATVDLYAVAVAVATAGSRNTGFLLFGILAMISSFLVVLPAGNRLAQAGHHWFLTRLGLIGAAGFLVLMITVRIIVVRGAR